MKANPDCIFAAASDELVRFALTTPLDPLFYLALNILAARADSAALAAVRAGATANEESLDRRFAVARACNDAPGAMDLVAREGGVIALVPDLIMAARDADRLAPLMDLCVKKKSLQSWYLPIAGFHALLDGLTRAAPADVRERLDILPARGEFAAENNSAGRKTVRLAAIVKVHNEGARVLRTVRTMLDFCDDVILWDHCSDDGSIDELEHAVGTERARVEIVRSTAPEYNERIIYDELFARARARSATHICHYDADEILSTTLTRDGLRQVATALAPGDAASVELVQLVGADGAYINYAGTRGWAATQYYLPQWRDFIFADDGRAKHAQTHLHGGWLPQASLRRRMFIDPAHAVNLHMDKPDAETARIKNDWYKAKELLLHGFPLEKLVYRYMFYALTYARMEQCLGQRPAVDAAMDAAIESRRTAEKTAELQQWLAGIKTPLEKWLFFHA